MRCAPGRLPAQSASPHRPAAAALRLHRAPARHCARASQSVRGPAARWQTSARTAARNTALWSQRQAAAVQRFAKQPARQQVAVSSTKPGRHKAEGQPLQREQRNAAVRVFGLADVALCAGHQPGVHHGGGKQAIAGNAQRQVQRQPGRCRHMQRLPGKSMASTMAGRRPALPAPSVSCICGNSCRSTAYTVSTSQAVIDRAGAKPKRGACRPTGPTPAPRRAAPRPPAERCGPLWRPGARLRQAGTAYATAAARASSQLMGEALGKIMDHSLAFRPCTAAQPAGKGCRQCSDLVCGAKWSFA